MLKILSVESATVEVLLNKNFFHELEIMGS